MYNDGVTFIQKDDNAGADSLYRKEKLMIKCLKNRKFVLTVAIVTAVAVAGVLSALSLTKPYAVYADGTKVDNPYVLKAGDDEVVLVKDKKTAEAVVEAVVDEYTPEGAQVSSIIIDKKLSVESKDLDRSEEPPTVLTEDEAVEYVLGQNQSDEPLFNVTVTAEKGSLEKVDAKKTYTESDKLYKDQSKVKNKGESGSRIVTDEIVSVNGTVTSTEEVDSTVVKDSEDKVVEKGTKDRPKDTVWGAVGGKILGKGSGTAVVNYALQFVGNPYVYGGTSLTKGADCSGFVQSIYARFGVSLPRTAYAQARAGKQITFAEAKPGDLITYSNHIAIYMGGGKIVHAANSRKGICVSSVRECGTILAVTRIIE